MHRGLGEGLAVAQTACFRRALLLIAPLRTEGCDRQMCSRLVAWRYLQERITEGEGAVLVCCLAALLPQLVLADSGRKSPISSITLSAKATIMVHRDQNNNLC